MSNYEPEGRMFESSRAHQQTRDFQIKPPSPGMGLAATLVFVFQNCSPRTNCYAVVAWHHVSSEPDPVCGAHDADQATYAARNG